MAPLADKTVIVTGATSGIGRACAVDLASQGAWVGVAGRNRERAEETLGLISEKGGGGAFVPLDVTEPKDWLRAVDAVVGERRTLHGLVNNAGESILKRIDKLTVEEFEFLLSVNYTGCFLGMQTAFPHLRSSGGGAIVNVSSVAGIRAGPNSTAYGATKAAMTGLTREAAREGRSVEPVVRVNSLHPGLIWGPGVAESMGEERAQEFRKYVVGKTPLRRVGEPTDIASWVSYLISDDGALVTGQHIVVDGGLNLAFP